MDTIVVATDFSEAAKNAALYALAFARQTGVKKIALYHSYGSVNLPDPLLGYAPVEISNESESNTKLHDLKHELQELAPAITIEAYHSSDNIETGLDQVCNMMHAQLIIIAMKGGSMLAETVVGSNTIRISRHAELPVIIVPYNVRFTPLEEILLAISYKQPGIEDLLEPVKKLLDITKATLFVLNIQEDEAGKELINSNIEMELAGYNPQYNFIHNPDFVQAMNDFADANKIDLIVTFPKKHGWFEEILNPSHTRRLVYHSHVPIMVVH